MNEDKRLTVSNDGALGIDLGSLSVIRDLAERLVHITSDQITASGRRLSPMPKKRFKVIGNITENGTRALYALWMSLDAGADLEDAKAGLAVHEEVETDHRERNALLVSLTAVARDMFWAQAKIDLNFHKCATIGIFRDWTVVETKDSNPMSGFVEMFSGRLPMPGSDDGE